MCPKERQLKALLCWNDVISISAVNNMNIPTFLFFLYFILLSFYLFPLSTSFPSFSSPFLSSSFLSLFFLFYERTGVRGQGRSHYLTAAVCCNKLKKKHKKPLFYFTLYNFAHPSSLLKTK
jgi:hypothetical protein